VKLSTSFCEQKEAKKLYESGAWALAQRQPMAQSQRSFLVLFLKKRTASFSMISG
jgi:hypothetical protein